MRLEDGHESFRKSLQRAFASVPIPPDARPADPPDRHMTVWQPATDKLWEFFGARREADGWHTRSGGAIRRVSKSPGLLDARRLARREAGVGCDGQQPAGDWGAMLLDELEQGRIDQALAMNVPAARAGVFAWPAQRTDGRGRHGRFPRGRACGSIPRWTSACSSCRS